MNLVARIKFIRSNLIGNLYRLSTTTPEVVEQNDQILVGDTDDFKQWEAREKEIKRKRNISRLNRPHRNRLHDKVPYDEPMIKAHLTVKYNRKMYGKYGYASGVNPSLCWPTKKDLKNIREYESVAHPYTIQEMMKMAADKRREENEKILKRDEEIAAKFAKLDQWKKELNDKIAKKAAEVLAAKEKKERLVEEVRRHFGFTLDPRDPRFQEMLTKREKEQKKAEKKARMEAKEKVMFAKLQQKNADIK